MNIKISGQQCPSAGDQVTCGKQQWTVLKAELSKGNIVLTLKPVEKDYTLYPSTWGLNY